MANKQIITPTINSASAIAGYCLAWVAAAFGGASGYVSATASLNAGKAKGLINTSRTLPSGVYVPVWFSMSYEPNGHIVIAKPDGSLVSTSTVDGQTVTWPNIAAAEKGWNMKYEGYSLYMPVVQVWRQVVSVAKATTATAKPVTTTINGLKAGDKVTFGNIFVGELHKWNGKNYLLNKDLAIQPADYNNFIPISAATLTNTHGVRLSNQTWQKDGQFFVLNGKYEVGQVAKNGLAVNIGGEPVWVSYKYVKKSK